MNLNINKDDSSINEFMYCWETFGSRPNKVVLHNSYYTSFFEKEIQQFYHVNSLTEIIPDNEDYIINEKSLLKISDDIYMSRISIDGNNEDSITSEIVFYYKNKDDSKIIEGLINKFSSFELTTKDEDVEKNINVVYYHNSEINIKPVKFNSNLESIELYYSNKTFKELNRLSKKINKTKKGLSILYGDTGTGKTSAINYLFTNINKNFIYIPNNMIDLTINSPIFTGLLEIYDECVVVVDDCDVLLNDPLSRSSLTIGNLIQMVDGYLSDEINVNLILIFNTTELEDVNDLILGVNNLIGDVKFEFLSDVESNNLSDHLGFKVKYKNKTKLVNIIKKKKDGGIKKIGF